MKNKKHIDQLFKERFEQFEATPSPQVWENIQAKMKEEKEDRKVIPIWWKLGGIAALLALLFTIGPKLFTDTSVTTDVVTTETSNEIKTDTTQKERPILDANGTEVASEGIDNNQKTSEEGGETNNFTSPAHQQDLLNKNTGSQSGVAAEGLSKEDSEEKTKTPTNLINKNTSVVPSNERDAVAVVPNTTTKNEQLNQNDPIKRDVVVAIDNEKEAVTTEAQEKTSEEIEKNTAPFIKKEMVVAKNPATEVAKTTTEEEKTETIDDNKKSIFDAINEQNAETAEEAIAKTNKPDKRWDVAPNFAPVYYSSIDGGSSLDPSFADNTQSGDVNFSYGVQVSYNINDRLSVRSGVSNVDLSYATSGVEVGVGPVSSALRTVDYGGKQQVTTVLDKGSIAMQPTGEFGNIILKSTGGNAQINQNITYYEVPLELKYAVINKKIGVNLIGGVSTLFLGDNEVSVSAQDFNTVLGEANNLSSVSFTTNVGLGFDYKLSSKFKFNIEPMFKYQLNPYTDSSVNFKPYYVGIYTGLSLSF